MNSICENGINALLKLLFKLKNQINNPYVLISYQENGMALIPLCYQYDITTLYLFSLPHNLDTPVFKTAGEYNINTQTMLIKEGSLYPKDSLQLPINEIYLYKCQEIFSMPMNLLQIQIFIRNARTRANAWLNIGDLVDEFLSKETQKILYDSYINVSKYETTYATNMKCLCNILLSLVNNYRNTNIVQHPGIVYPQNFFPIYEQYSSDSNTFSVPIDTSHIEPILIQNQLEISNSSSSSSMSEDTEPSISLTSSAIDIILDKTEHNDMFLQTTTQDYTMNSEITESIDDISLQPIQDINSDNELYIPSCTFYTGPPSPPLDMVSWTIPKTSTIEEPKKDVIKCTESTIIEKEEITSTPLPPTHPQVHQKIKFNLSSFLK